MLDWAALREFGYQRKRQEAADGGTPIFVQHNPATDILEDPGDRLDLRLTFNSEKNYARVFGDLINYDNRDAIKEMQVVVSNAAGKAVKRASAIIDEYAYARAVIKFEALPTGDYQVRLDCQKCGRQGHCQRRQRVLQDRSGEAIRVVAHETRQHREGDFSLDIGDLPGSNVWRVGTEDDRGVRWPSLADRHARAGDPGGAGTFGPHDGQRPKNHGERGEEETAVQRRLSQDG